MANSLMRSRNLTWRREILSVAVPAAAFGIAAFTFIVSVVLPTTPLTFENNFLIVTIPVVVLAVSAGLITGIRLPRSSMVYRACGILIAFSMVSAVIFACIVSKDAPGLSRAVGHTVLLMCLFLASAIALGAFLLAAITVAIRRKCFPHMLTGHDPSGANESQVELKTSRITNG